MILAPTEWQNCWENPDPGNSLRRHQKCFQGQGPLWTRGWNFAQDRLDGDESCLADHDRGGRPVEPVRGHSVPAGHRHRTRRGASALGDGVPGLPTLVLDLPDGDLRVGVGLPRGHVYFTTAV